jgi:hypothetical protein
MDVIWLTEFDPGPRIIPIRVIFYAMIGQKLKILLFTTIALVALQACKVVVQDPYGNRIGVMDSLNWDSLLSLSSSSWDWTWSDIPPYSSSSWTWPPISSGGSSSFEFPSSSTDYSSSSVAQNCIFATVVLYPAVRWYSWIEQSATGQRLTAFARDTSRYPGITSETLLPTSSMGTQPTPSDSEPFISKQLICESDPAYEFALTGDTVYQEMPGSDTLTMNYGSNPRDPIIPPQIKILNKADLIATFENINPYMDYKLLGLNVSHFPGDEAQISVRAPQWITLQRSQPTSIPNRPEPCATSQQNPAPVTLAPTTSGAYYLMALPDQTVNPNTSVRWDIRVRNRFGYRDSVVITTQIRDFGCVVTDLTSSSNAGAVSSSSTALP